MSDPWQNQRNSHPLWRVVAKAWHGLFLAGRRHNHRLIGFYSYHLETVNRRVEAVNRWAGKLRQSPRAATTLRMAVFWPLMGFAALLLYTGNSPFMRQYIPPAANGRSADQSVPGTPIAYLNQQDQPPAANAQSATPPAGPVNQPATASGSSPAKSSTPATAATHVQRAGSKPAGKTQPAQSLSKAAGEDPVAAALAELPPFHPDQAVQPAAGRTVTEVGWNRDALTGDWEWSPGVAIAPEQPGETVVAAYAGVVTEVKKERAGTWCVVLTHRSGWNTEYGGLEKVSVQPHDMVHSGDPVGKAGADESGLVSFTLRQGNAPVDPADYLQ